MKGIVAPLLTICMTGMVWSQQPSNTANQFGSPPSTGIARSILNGSTNNNPSDSAAGNPATAKQSGPLEMALSDQLIEQFRQKGQLSAEIRPRLHVNEIVFFHSSKSSASLAPGQMVPTSKSNQELRFELSDSDIQRIKQSGLSYKISPFEQGRYAKVVVDYRRPNTNAATSIFRNASSTPPPTTANNVFGSGTPKSNYLPPPQQGSNNNLDRGFMGPTIPQDVANHRRDSNSTMSNSNWPNKTALSGPTTGNGSSAFGQPPLRSNDTSSTADKSASTNRWPNRNNGFGTPQTTNNNDQFQRISPDSSNRTKFGQGPVAGQTPQFGGTQLTEADKMQEELKRRQAEAMQRNIDLQKQRLAELEEKNRLEERAIMEQRRSMDQIRSDMARRKDQTNDRVLPPDTVNAGFGGFPDRMATNYSDHLVNGLGDRTRKTGMVSPQPSNNGVRSMAASIRGPQSLNQENSNQNGNRVNSENDLLADAKNRDAEKTEGIIYFMLLFSLGLNVYLGWISRGFYVRYNELADELRETFTATM